MRNKGKECFRETTKPKTKSFTEEPGSRSQRLTHKVMICVLKAYRESTAVASASD